MPQESETLNDQGSPSTHPQRMKQCLWVFVITLMLLQGISLFKHYESKVECLVAMISGIGWLLTCIILISSLSLFSDSTKRFQHAALVLGLVGAPICLSMLWWWPEGQSCCANLLATILALPTLIQYVISRWKAHKTIWN